MKMITSLHNLILLVIIPVIKRTGKKIRKLLKMRNCLPKKDSSKVAEAIRTALAQKLWKENEGHGVQ